jgi:hypothetical protein
MGVGGSRQRDGHPEGWRFSFRRAKVASPSRWRGRGVHDQNGSAYCSKARRNGSSGPYSDSTLEAQTRTM